MNDSTLGLPNPLAIAIAAAIDQHDQPIATKAKRRWLADRIRNELGEDDQQVALDLARLLRRAVTRKGLYQRPERIHAHRSPSGLGQHTRDAARPPHN